MAGRHIDAYAEMLAVRNGFYAFEGALHVFPSASYHVEIGIEEWNSEELWRGEYKGLADGLLFFAEDVLGCQFAINGDGVQTFNIETGSSEKMAEDLESWADAILADYDLHAGWSLAHEYQMLHGVIKPGQRLHAAIPFVAGGKYEVANLKAIDSVELMRFNGYLATQIRDLPDGAQIRIKITE